MALKIKIKVFKSSMKIATCTLNDTQRFGIFFLWFYLFLAAVALLNNLFEYFKLGSTLTDCSNENLDEQQF